MADWQFLNPYGQGQSGSPTYWGGGAQQVFMRDRLDSMRSRVDAKTPEASYPDGYLGTINSRREDRLLDAVKKKVGERSYQRGVHRGERIDPGDYEWPNNFNPQIGLIRQSKAFINDDATFECLRFAPIQTMQEKMLVNDGKGMMSQSNSIPAAVADQDPRRMSYLRNMAPGWR